MTTRSRRAREMEAVREKILDAARDLFVKHGYDSVSMRKIADAIDYTAAALYTHFRDKAELMRALCRRDFGEFTQTMLKLGRIEDPIQRIRKFGQAYVRFAAEHPNQYRLMFMAPHPQGVEPEAEDLERKDDPDQDGYAALRHAAAEAIQAGQLRPELRDPELVAQVFWAAMHGIASLQITHASDDWIDWRSLDKRVRAMGDAILVGMLSDDARKENAT